VTSVGETVKKENEFPMQAIQHLRAL